MEVQAEHVQDQCPSGCPAIRVQRYHDRRGKANLSYEVRDFPNFCELLNKWLSQRVPRDEAMPWATSIAINMGYAGRLHRDRNNVGPSFLIVFGFFKEVASII